MNKMKSDTRKRWRMYRKKERDVKCLNKRKAGQSIKQIAKQIHRTPRTVSRILKAGGALTRHEICMARNTLIGKYLGKYNKTQTAKLMGITRQRLYQILNERVSGCGQ